MLHDRDEKYEGSDEPEYHFSDEDGGDGIDYADTEATKEEAASASEPRAATTTGGRVAPSKRMIISLVVFLALVYVVYKMVAPTSQTPSTEITAPVTAQTTTQMPKKPAPEMTKTAPAPVVAAMPASSNAANAQVAASPQPPALVPMSQQQPVVAAAPPASPGMQTGTQANMQPPAPIAPTAQAAPTNQPAAPVVAALPAMTPPAGQPQPQQSIQTQASQPPAALAQQPSQISPQSMPQQAVAQPVAPPAQQGMPQQPAMPEVTGMPAVIPVQSPSPAYNINSPSTVAIQNPAGTEAKIAALEADSSKLISQMQSDYVQKLNDFATQNKALQDQVQTLNSRMATMETQLNQLVQALTHQNQSERSEPAAVPGMEEAAPEHRISYNVQAIIPGRAWLRSDNGETVTVAEGDVVKSLGRVMKIDPYDGVVEINTGSKTVSLSYGTG